MKKPPGDTLQIIKLGFLYEKCELSIAAAKLTKIISEHDCSMDQMITVRTATNTRFKPGNQNYCN